MSEARTKHYENSLPWDDKGARLLTVTNYAHYTELMNALRERVVRQRARFIEDYDNYVDQARLDLGKLFRIEDYPSKEALQGKFAIRYRITPVPDADHFIAKLALRRHRPGEARHRAPHRGAAPRRGGRPLPPARRGGRAGLGPAAGRTTTASRSSSATR